MPIEGMVLWCRPNEARRQQRASTSGCPSSAASFLASTNRYYIVRIFVYAYTHTSHYIHTHTPDTHRQTTHKLDLLFPEARLLTPTRPSTQAKRRPRPQGTPTLLHRWESARTVAPPAGDATSRTLPPLKHPDILSPPPFVSSTYHRPAVPSPTAALPSAIFTSPDALCRVASLQMPGCLLAVVDIFSVVR